MTSQTPTDVVGLIAKADMTSVVNELVKLTLFDPDAYEKFVKVFQRSKKKGGK
jgi:hypothetical protein